MIEWLRQKLEIASTSRGCPASAGQGFAAVIVCLLLLICDVLASAVSVATAQEAMDTLRIAYVEIADDERYEPIRTTERIVLRAPHRPFLGAEVGIDDAAALKRVTGTTFALERITSSPGKVAQDIAKARTERGAGLFLLDLPPVELRVAAAALKGTGALAFNISAAEDELRREMCAAEIVHAVPSHAMQADALVQLLVSKKWRELVLLEGPEAADAAFAAAIVRAAKKFGARLVAHSKFKLGSDPRDREVNNPALLTAINRDYDVVIVADAGLEMVRAVPFSTVRPRLVAGAGALEPEAWHWTWDRSGGPQVNGRFQTKSGGLRMSSADWAAWVSVKMIAEAVLRTQSRQVEKLKQYIVRTGSEPGGGFDGGKGLAVSVRAWDQQVRQPMMLAGSLAVIAIAPMDGFLHQTNRLDTLGDDAPETSCRLDQRGR